MSLILNEVQEVQNPALGAVLLWRFVVEYVSESTADAGCPVPLLFLVLPTVLHKETLDYLESTRRPTGLRGFAAKFSVRNADADILLAVHERAIALRSLSLRSLRIAANSSLLMYDQANGGAFPLSTTEPRAGIASEIKLMMRNAGKLGMWCGRLTLHEVATTMKVAF